MTDAWRIRLRLEGPFGTPMTSGTLFGHLCWAMVERDRGAARLEALIARLKDEPFLLSDVVPEELLPRPLLPPQPLPRDAEGNPDPRAIDAFEHRKKLPWMTRAGFLAIRDHLSARGLAEQLVAGPDDGPWRQPHVAIDRRDARVRDQGGLYFLDDWWPAEDARGRDLYLRTTLPITEVVELLARVGRTGYGRDITWGRGRFAVEGHEADDGLLAARGQDDGRLMSLSHGCLTANMQQDARWRVAPHFGKVAATVLARGGRPWKLPVLLLQPGATWRPDDGGPFGRWLDGVYQDKDKAGHAVGHHAFHLPVAYREAQDRRTTAGASAVAGSHSRWQGASA